MNKEQVIKTLKKVKQNSPKRNFKQSIELIINLKGINLKKQDNQINVLAVMPYPWGKKNSVCAFVGSELKKQAEEVFDETIHIDEFQKYSDKKLLKKLAKKHDFFVAQANVMPQVATTFGRVLGPLGKMPNPKIGAVLPPTANPKQIYDKLQKSKRLMSRANPIIQTGIGKEDSKEEELAENAVAVYNTILHAVPSDIQNIKNIYIKSTMGPSFLVGETISEEEPKKDEKTKEKDPEAIKEEKAEDKEKKKEQPSEKEVAKVEKKEEKSK